MDALCVTGPAMAALCRVTSEASLRRLNVDPSVITREASHPPYRLSVSGPKVRKTCFGFVDPNSKLAAKRSEVNPVAVNPIPWVHCGFSLSLGG